MLKIENLTKRYGGKCALDNLSLEIGEGEICAFIGHNGVGKTATLKAAVGILAPDEGRIYVDGISVMDGPLEAERSYHCGGASSPDGDICTPTA